MKKYAQNDSTDRPVSLKNEATPDAAVYARSNPTPTVGASADAVAAAAAACGGWGGGGVFITIRQQR